MNKEIDKHFREIKRKCSDSYPGHYPGYCHRAVTDLLSLLNQMREEYADIENGMLNLRYLDGFIQMEDMEALR